MINFIPKILIVKIGILIFEETAKIILPINAKKTYFNNLECLKFFTNSIYLNKHFFH